MEFRIEFIPCARRSYNIEGKEVPRGRPVTRVRQRNKTKLKRCLTDSRKHRDPGRSYFWAKREPAESGKRKTRTVNGPGPGAWLNRRQEAKSRLMDSTEVPQRRRHGNIRDKRQSWPWRKVWCAPMWLKRKKLAGFTVGRFASVASRSRRFPDELQLPSCNWGTELYIFLDGRGPSKKMVK